MRLRTSHARRSSARPESGGSPSAAAIASCAKCGSASRAITPIIELSTGTSRQPSDAHALGRDDLVDRLQRGRALARIAGEEGGADGVLALRWQLGVEHLAEERVGDLDQDPRAVAHVGLGAGGAAVVEVAQRRQAELDHAVAGAPVHVDHERDTARVVLEARVVEAVARRAARRVRLRWS